MKRFLATTIMVNYKICPCGAHSVKSHTPFVNADQILDFRITEN
jgi:hypothetical protein